MKEVILDIFTMFSVEDKEQMKDLVDKVCLRIAEESINTVADVSNLGELSQAELSAFYPCMEIASQKNVSFVVVGKSEGYVGDFPIVPTVREAEDYIAMEDMQRMLSEDF